MVHLFKSRLNILIPTALRHERTEYLSKVQNYLVALISLSFVYIVMGLVDTFQGRQQVVMYEIFGLATCLSSYLCFRWLKDYKIPAHMILLSGMLVILQAAQVTGGIQSGAAMWIVVGPVIVAMLISRNWAIAWVGLSFFCSTFLVVAPRIPIAGYEHIPVNPLDINKLFNSYCCTLLLFVVVRNYERNQKNIIDKIENQKEQHSNLARVLSHDLAGLLSVVWNGIEIMKMFDDHRRTEALGRVQFALKSMRDILRQTKDMQAVGSGKAQLQLVPVSLDEMFENAMLIFRDKLKEKNLKLNYSRPEGRSPYILAEPISFSNEVLNNFVSNAIKFSFPNKEIHIKVLEKDRYYLMQIQDQGMGIPAESLNQLFTSQSRFQQKGTDGEGGTGFGLLLAKGYLQIYGAEVHVESVHQSKDPEHCGTSIYLYLKKAAEPQKSFKKSA